MRILLHKADTRGLADHDWLLSRHTFSFAGYYDESRMGFGALRVINDDVVQPGFGFGTHSHSNMEIVSIPLAGSLRHQDSMGNTQLIQHGEVQIMSAGRGISHSEYNGSDSEIVNFLQIWVLPKRQNIEPRYEQKQFSANERQNRFQTVVSPDAESDAVWINQDAWFSLGDYEAGLPGVYTVQRIGNQAYFFVLDGTITIAGERLSRRDGLGVEDLESIDFDIHEDCQLLVMDVPVE